MSTHQEEKALPGKETGEEAETRGGEHPDWAAARPGQPLPQLPEENDDPGNP